MGSIYFAIGLCVIPVSRNVAHRVVDGFLGVP
jgi:hypothetical protein